jgi:hypothetical protein
MSMFDNADKFNSEVRTWKDETLEDLDKQFDVLNIKHVKRSPSTVPSREVLKAFLAYRQGLINRIGIKFPRHMVFVHKGVGKGVPAILAGTAATNRQPKEWFNPVVETKVDELADIVAENIGDLVVKNLRIN